MDKNFLQNQMCLFQQKFSALKTYPDYHIFTLLCIDYFFFEDSGSPFDIDTAIEWMTDGSNDGGIDAVFNDPTSENNDVIIVQSKHYNATDLSKDTIASSSYKINQTINDIRNNKVANYSETVVTAFRNSTSEMGDNGTIKIIFFTSYHPTDKRRQNSLEKTLENCLPTYDTEINFYSDIESQIELCENGKPFVEYDKLTIDAKNNFLKYEDSVIVNISAQSLQNLQNRRRNGLLGMNLRYYVKQKVVDTGIAKTIKTDPDNFWYKNNGILIICDDYEIDGKEIKLYNFSIINGGQTTSRIGKLDIEKDFYLQCKVVKTKGDTQKLREDFSFDIAEATNSQKPIKKADLKANSSEQNKLKLNFAAHHVYYITKKGDKAPKQYSEPYQIATLEQVGKLGLAAILQMPGAARNNLQRMYDDEYYYPIFGQDTRVSVLVDLLKVSYYYDQFTKKYIKEPGRFYEEKTVLPMLKNGKTFQIACLAFLCKINYGVFSYDDVSRYTNNIDGMKAVLRNMGSMKNLISAQIQDEQGLFMEIFSVIGEEVLGYCFENAVEKAADESKTIVASDYLKSDNNYYKDIIKRLWSRYRNNSQLQNDINLICGKGN